MRTLWVLILLTAPMWRLLAGEIDDLRIIAGFYTDGKFNLAKGKATAFLKSYPTSQHTQTVRYLVASIAVSEKNYSVAEPIFQDLYRQNHDPSVRGEVILGLAESRFYLGKTDSAGKLCTEFLGAYPSHERSYRAHHLKGLIAYKDGKYGLAVEEYDKALKKKNIPDIQVDKIRATLRNKPGKQALNTVEGVVNDLAENGKPQAEPALLLYLDHCLQEGDLNKVLGFRQDLIKPGSTHRDEYLLLRGIAYYEKQDYSEALKLLNSIKKPGSRARYYKGLTLLKSGKSTEAAVIFADLEKNGDTPEIKRNSYFFLAQAEEKNNPGKAAKMLEEFIVRNPGDPLADAARFQAGFNAYEKSDYTRAIQYFDQALKGDMDKSTREKAMFLLGDSRFHGKDYQRAVSDLEKYLKEHPRGAYADDALYKTGLANYLKDDFDAAGQAFSKLIDQYPQSHKRGLAYFYQGEIQLSRFRNTLTQPGGDRQVSDNLHLKALESFRSALSAQADAGLVNKRLALLHYLHADYKLAGEAIAKIPDTAGYTFDKQMLRGHVYQATKQYNPALEAYRAAEKAAPDEVARNEAKANLAWVYYLLDRFDESEKIFRTLSGDAATSGKYNLLAAKSAFSAKKYSAAIQYYGKFLEKTKSGDDYYRALIGTADSYYNLKDYRKAADWYRKILSGETSTFFLENALDGLKWSLTVGDDFIAEINDRLKGASGNYRALLLEKKAVYYSGKGEWDDALDASRALVSSLPDYYRIAEVYRVMVLSMENLGQFDEADGIYRKLVTKGEPDPNLYIDWALLRERQGKPEAATEVLKQGSSRASSPALLLELLRLQLENNLAGGAETYANLVRDTRDQTIRDRATLIWIEYKINQGQSADIATPLEALLNHNDNRLKVKAHYLKGLMHYKNRSYEDAVPQLLGVRYITNDTAMIVQAEYLACKAYIELGQKDEARALLNSISGQLSADKRDEILGKLK